MKKSSQLVLATLATAGVVAFANPVQARDTGDWDKPSFVYGGGLSQAEIDRTAQIFNIDSLEEVNSGPISGEDYNTYLNRTDGNTSNMVSSVMVEKLQDGNGVEVVLETPENITQVTEDQYTNAAITAGVEDAIITVGSIRPVTGESALTGVYKAFALNGEDLDQDRMEVAQDELDITNSVAQSLDQSQTENLDKAIVEIKTQLAEIKERTDELATREEIEQIINDALAKYDLSNVLTQEQINRFLDLFEKYQQTDAIDSQTVINQLNIFGNEIGARVENIYTEAQESGLLDQIANFFKDLWNSLMSFFN